MTATVTVKTRAWPAVVTIKSKTEGAEGHNVETDDTDIAARTSMDFTIDESLELSVRVIRPDEAKSHLPLDPTDVPGRAQNDALMTPIQTGDEDPESSDD